MIFIKTLINIYQIHYLLNKWKRESIRVMKGIYVLLQIKKGKSRHDSSIHFKERKFISEYLQLIIVKRKKRSRVKLDKPRFIA